MITWIVGNSGVGKTTLAKKILKLGQIHLDGDDIRQQTLRGYSLTKEDRWEHNLNIARWSRLLAGQGFDVVVSTICPYEELRQQVYLICGCRFVYLEFEGDDQVAGSPFEKPMEAGIKYGTNRNSC